MGKYTPEIQDALEAIREAGAKVKMTYRLNAGSFDPVTEVGTLGPLRTTTVDALIESTGYRDGATMAFDPEGTIRKDMRKLTIAGASCPVKEVEAGTFFEFEGRKWVSTGGTALNLDGTDPILHEIFVKRG